MEDMENKIVELAERAASKDSILTCLKILSSNPHLSFQNLLLVFEQNPKAEGVCGRKAWEQIGRTVREDAKPIMLLFPNIQRSGEQEKVYQSEYLKVSCYCYDSTEGKPYIRIKQLAFADRVTLLTGATWEIVPEEALKSSLDHGFYDRDRNTFCLSQNCSKEQQEPTIMELYIDYVLQEKGITDKLLKMAIVYVMNEHFGLKNTIISALFGKLGKYTIEEKLIFLKKTGQISKQILDDLEGYTLNFNETAFLNDLLASSDAEKIGSLLDGVAESLMDEELKEEIFVLREKLKKTKQSCLDELYRRKKERSLFTIPPFRLEMDIEDFIKVERSNYHGI